MDTFHENGENLKKKPHSPRWRSKIICVKWLACAAVMIFLVLYIHPILNHDFLWIQAELTKWFVSFTFLNHPFYHASNEKRFTQLLFTTLIIPFWTWEQAKKYNKRNDNMKVPLFSYFKKFTLLLNAYTEGCKRGVFKRIDEMIIFQSHILPRPSPSLVKLFPWSLHHHLFPLHHHHLYLSFSFIY